MRRSSRPNIPGRAIARRGLTARLATAAALSLAVPALALPALAGPASAAPAGQGPGTLLVWGNNSDDLLGPTFDNRTDNATVPVPFHFPEVNLRSETIGCGAGYLLTAADQVLSWGSDDEGQLGDGKAPHDSDTATPIKLAATTRVVDVAAGCEHALALTSAGQVLAWGDNTGGELGINSTTRQSNVPVQVTFPAGVRIMAVSAGDLFSLALTASGQVYAWGNNDAGQLGNGLSTGFSRVPVLVHLPLGARVTSISAGLAYALALTSSGQVLAWGDDRQGELGNGQAGAVGVAPVMVRLKDGTRVRSISAGGTSAMALTVRGQVLTWGSNQQFQLGNGTTVNNSTVPVQVQLPGGRTADQIAAGGVFDLAVTDNRNIVAWGNNQVGELGDNHNENFSNVPVPLDIPASAFEVSLGTGSNALDSVALVQGRP